MSREISGAERHLLCALDNFATASVNLAEAWEEATSGADGRSNGRNDRVEQVMCAGYPFEQDFLELAERIISWKWSVLEQMLEQEGGEQE